MMLEKNYETLILPIVKNEYFRVLSDMIQAVQNRIIPILDESPVALVEPTARFRYVPQITLYYPTMTYNILDDTILFSTLTTRMRQLEVKKSLFNIKKQDTFYLVKEFKDKENASILLFVIILSPFIRVHTEDFISKVDFFSSCDDDTTK